MPSHERLLDELEIVEDLISRGKEYIANNPAARDIEAARREVNDLVAMRRDMEAMFAKHADPFP
jgi:hypothetical protein